jgi:hypothetical protein
MSDESTGSALGRLLILTLLMIATLGFGLAGLCGGVFTIMSLPGLFASGPENFSGAALIIAIPSLLIGGGLAWWCGRAMYRRMGDRNDDGA